MVEVGKNPPEMWKSLCLLKLSTPEGREAMGQANTPNDQTLNWATEQEVL